MELENILNKLAYAEIKGKREDRLIMLNNQDWDYIRTKTKEIINYVTAFYDNPEGTDLYNQLNKAEWCMDILKQLVKEDIECFKEYITELLQAGDNPLIVYSEEYKNIIRTICDNKPEWIAGHEEELNNVEYLLRLAGEYL